jgi:hypothetical protein
MEFPHLEPPLRQLLLRYRDIPYSDWLSAHEAQYEFDDHSKEGEPFWQSHTTVLEVGTAEDGRRYANVSITIYPEGVRSMPPAPNAGLVCYEGGVCRIWTPWGDEYDYKQPAK